MKETNNLLPWYLNGTLDISEHQEVEARLKKDETAAAHLDNLSQLSKALHTQDVQTPSHEVETRLFAKIHHEHQTRRGGFLQWIWSAPLAALVFALLWLVIQPGTQLQWAVRGEAAATFQVYRAPVGSLNFELIAEIPAVAGQQNYRYRDTGIFPGKTYHYAIEVISQDGTASFSPTVANNSWETFTAYTILFLTSFVLTLGLITIRQELKIQHNRYAIIY